MSLYKYLTESMELNESKDGLIDYFYRMVNDWDIDYKEQVDYLLTYINESDLAEAIDDFKDYMGIDELNESNNINVYDKIAELI